MGHCRAADYYFTIDHQTIEYKGETHKHVELVLCWKWNWWMNGQTFLPHRDGQTGRDFSDYITPAMRDRWDEDQVYTDDPEELRAQLIKAGLEELPAMLPIYREYIVAAHAKLDEPRKPWDENDDVR